MSKKVRKVRRDVIIKLFKGLEDLRNYSIDHKTIAPKSYKYRTNKCDHYVYYNPESHYYYFNTIEYDGSRRHSALGIMDILNIINN